MREPIFNIPNVIMIFVISLVLVFMWQNTLNSRDEMTIILQHGFIPIRFSLWLHPEATDRMILETASDYTLLSLISYAFLHGSWSHVIMNSVWIVIFGTPIARRLGAMRVILLMVITALAGILVHWSINRLDQVPVIGASAIASGLTGAAIRFVFSDTLTQGVNFSHRGQLMSVREIIRHRQAFAFTLIWLVMNFVFGAFAQTLGFSEDSVAWQAHLGGFFGGFFLIKILDKKEPAP